MIDFIVDTLKQLISIDTRSNKNNEIEAAIYIKEKLCQFNIWSEIIEPIPGKGSVVAYLPGRDKAKRELLLLSHVDTAEFGNLSKWNISPCIGDEYEGRIFGRGAIDCKGLVSLWIGILAFLKLNNIIIDRGIIFAAVADEENGGTYGSKYLLDTHHLVKRCKYVLSEGGGFPIKLGNKLYYTCQNAEKGEIVYSLDTKDKQSLSDNVKYTGNMLENIFRGLNTTKIYNYRLLNYLFKQSLNKKMKRRINIKEILSNTLSYEKFDSDLKLHINYLPEILRKDIEKIFEVDYGIKLHEKKLIREVLPSFTSIDTDLYQLIREETEKQIPDSKVIPYMTPGYSDNRFFRYEGKEVYGFFPLDSYNKISGIHGPNEYISVKSLQIAFNLLKEIVFRFCVTSG